MRRVKGWFFAVLLITVLCSSAALAGGVTVSPAKIVAQATQGDYLPPLSVHNGGSEPVTIRVTVGPGEHTIHGVPVLGEGLDPSSPDSLLTLSPTGFKLEPGRTKTVTAKVKQPVRGGLYPVIYFEIQKQKGTPGMVQPVRRLAVLTLLTSPGSRMPKPLVREVLLDQVEPGNPVQLVSLVSNTGNRHLTVGGKFLLAKPDGSQDQIPIHPVTILPGCSRRVSGQWRPDQMPTGEYDGHLVLNIQGGPTITEAFDFQMINPYELARPLLETEGWRLVSFGIHPGRPSIEGIVRNSGNVPVSVKLSVDIKGEVTNVRRQASIQRLAPGEAIPIDFSVADIELSEPTYALAIKTEATAFGRTYAREETCQIKVGAPDAMAFHP